MIRTDITGLLITTSELTGELAKWAVRTTTDYGENYMDHYGDTIDECLEKAVSARAALKGD